MRTIKFRGKDITSGKLEYGNLIVDHFLDGEVECSIVQTYATFAVIPETVEQFTGLYDKNGNEIYEGDIVKDIDDELQQVRWLWSGWGLQRLSDGEKWGWCIVPGYDKKREYVEVIGNIHDNPEMMKGDKQ